MGLLIVCAGTSLYAQPGKIKQQVLTNNIAATASAKAVSNASVKAASAKATDASVRASQRATAKAELQAARRASFKAGLEARTQTQIKSSLTEGNKTHFYEPMDKDATAKNDLNFQKRLHTNLKNVPAPVAKSFAAVSGTSNINWSKDNGNWYVHYDANGYKMVSAYSANGENLYTATKLPRTDLPQPVVTYTTTTATTLSNQDILLIQVPGQSPIYQLTLMNGNVIYVNNSGTAASDFNSNALVIR